MAASRGSTAKRSSVRWCKEYEAGQSINQLCRKHGIGGKMTIQKWVRCYSRRGVGVCPAPGVASPEDGAALTGEAERLRESVRKTTSVRSRSLAQRSASMAATHSATLLLISGPAPRQP